MLQTEIESRPLIFNSFTTRDANDNPVYHSTTGYDQLKKVLEDKLAEYNENNAVMDLVSSMRRLCAAVLSLDSNSQLTLALLAACCMQPAPSIAAHWSMFPVNPRD